MSEEKAMAQCLWMARNISKAKLRPHWDIDQPQNFKCTTRKRETNFKNAVPLKGKENFAGLMNALNFPVLEDQRVYKAKNKKHTE